MRLRIDGSNIGLLVIVDGFCRTAIMVRASQNTTRCPSVHAARSTRRSRKEMGPDPVFQTRTASLPKCLSCCRTGQNLHDVSHFAFCGVRRTVGGSGVEVRGQYVHTMVHSSKRSSSPLRATDSRARTSTLNCVSYSELLPDERGLRCM